MSRKDWRVEEQSAVLQDYIAISEHIERWTEDRALADRTVDAIRTFVKSLATAPHRGTRRDDLRPGLRIVPFGKRTAIAFEITEDAGIVTILRVFHGGQDYETVMRGARASEIACFG
jgi:plasmid stabilization system protein ParE